MSPLGIVLIIIGIIIIIVSCLLVDKNGISDGKNRMVPFSYEENVSEEDKKKLIDSIQERLKDISEGVIIQTDDTLSKVSNEKIIAVNEFSDQILEKIKRNHEEVVFLYNMLNDKEKELKAAVKEIDLSKKKVNEILEGKTAIEKLQAMKGAKASSEKAVVKSQLEQRNSKDSQANIDIEVSAPNTLNANNNTQILALYSQGKSIMEISKFLGMGQGEVKLVIDLYKGKK